MPIKPHGGTLVDLTVPKAEAPELEKRADGLVRIPLSPMERSDLELLATGAYSPLRGFMGKADYETVVETGHLASGLPWTLPVVLGADADAAGQEAPRHNANPDSYASSTAWAEPSRRRRSCSICRLFFLQDKSRREQPLFLLLV